MGAMPVAVVQLGGGRRRARPPADLAADRTRGWCVTRGDSVAGVVAAATPVALEEEAFATAGAGPLERVPPTRVRRAAVALAARRRREADG